MSKPNEPRARSLLYVNHVYDSPELDGLPLESVESGGSATTK
jgi:hypothetical protein